jgi:hypothetical protein
MPRLRTKTHCPVQGCVSAPFGPLAQAGDLEMSRALKGIAAQTNAVILGGGLDRLGIIPRCRLLSCCFYWVRARCVVPLLPAGRRANHEWRGSDRRAAEAAPITGSQPGPTQRGRDWRANDLRIQEINPIALPLSSSALYPRPCAAPLYSVVGTQEFRPYMRRSRYEVSLLRWGS